MSKAAWQAAALAKIGTEMVTEDAMLPDHSNALYAALDDDRMARAGDVLPPLFHWLYFNPAPRADRLKEDGHEKLGGFLPATPYSRRMWAGSDVQFHLPLQLGQPSQRRSIIRDVTFKEGRSGPLCFVKVTHDISQNGQLCLTDTHNIVYRQAETVAAGAPVACLAPPNENAVNSVLLFRYSALTYNGHRIHYDAPYAREIEGYPGLVVHGPLMATLMVRAALAQHRDKHITRFGFRGVAPLFAMEGFTIHVATNDHAETKGRTSQISLTKTDGTVCVTAEAVWG